jgi:class 3 adenylate cyclase
MAFMLHSSSLLFAVCLSLLFLSSSQMHGNARGKQVILPLLRRATCNNIPSLHHGRESMKFDEALDQVRELLRQRNRVTYRSLKLRYQLDDELLAGITDELIKAERVAADENGEVLIWVKGINGESEGEKGKWRNGEKEQNSGLRMPDAGRSDGERRQLTVMFCDLVNSTALSAQLDPEELREVVRAYQETCTEVIRRYDGYVAQHLGDGLLVYFGYPVAHEDDAARTVRAGLEIIQALRGQVTGNWGQGKRDPFHVRIGIHTGLVVIGEIGSSEKREILALGETPNIAARVQGTANPDEVIISAATYRLVEGLFDTEDRGKPDLKGVTTPLTLYRVIKESEARSRFEVVVRKGLTPLVGREHEYGLLQERWQRVKSGAGQVVLLSGEPGIGKSRLVEALRETIEHEGASCLELRCSPYTQNSAFAPVIEHLQRTLQFRPEDSADEKLHKLSVGRTAVHSYRQRRFRYWLHCCRYRILKTFLLSPSVRRSRKRKRKKRLSRGCAPKQDNR